MSKWAYLAGFVDGDGSIFISRRKSKKSRRHGEYRLFLSLANVNQDFLKVMKTRYPGTVSKWKSDNYRAEYIRWEGPAAQVVIRKILPHLIAKHYQAALALHFSAPGKGAPGISRSSGLKRLHQDQKEIFDLMRKANRKWSKGKTRR